MEHPFGLKEIKFGLPKDGEMPSTFTTFTPDPVEVKPEIWEYYLNRKGKVFLRSNWGRKATFTTDTTHPNFEYLRKKGYGSKHQMKFEKEMKLTFESSNISPDTLLAAFGGEVENNTWIAPEIKPANYEDVWEYYLKRKNLLYFRHPLGGKFAVDFDLNTEKGKTDFDFIANRGYGFKLKRKSIKFGNHEFNGNLDFKGTVFNPVKINP